MDVDALQKALLSASVEEVEAILKNELPTNKELDRCQRCLRVIKFLLEQNKNFNILQTNYSTLLHFAIMNQANDSFNLILESNNFSINAVNPRTKMTLLHLVALTGTKQMAKALLEHGAQVNALSIYNITPLHYACINYDYALGFAIFLKLDFNNYLKDTSRVEVVQLLLDHGSHLEIEAGHGKETALLLACANGYVEIVELLLQYGANLNVEDRRGENVLHKAMHICHPGLIKIILEKGFDSNRKDICGRTPLQHFFKQDLSPFNYKASLDLLIKYGADVHIKDYDGNTMLHTACMNLVDNSLYLKYFLKRNININALNKCGETPLDVALQTQGLYRTDFENLKMLCAFIAKLKAADSFICEQNLRLIKNNPKIKELYNKFEFEVNKMKKEKISSSSHVCYFDILNASSQKLTAFVRNDEIMKSLKSEKYKEMFPLYASILMMDAINEAEIRRDLIETCAFRLRRHVKRSLPHLIVDNIFMYLSDEDLENFEKAFLNKVFQ